jgi:hypothetical protein
LNFIDLVSGCVAEIEKKDAVRAAWSRWCRKRRAQSVALKALPTL